MNSCLYCGKEIPEGRKFCSSSCSAKHNNAHRVRKPWTEEQRKRNSKYWGPRTCKYCGKVVEEGRRTVCEECDRYSFPILFKKLQLCSGPLKSRYEEAVKLVQTWYFQDKLSIPQIWKKTGLAPGVIRSLLILDGRETRKASGGQRNAILQGIRTLPDPGTSYNYKSGKHTSWEGKVFHFRSSWEEQLMQELDNRKIPYLYEPFMLRYFDTQKQEERVAVPDFFFPESNTILELKSSFTYDEQNMRDKFKAYQEKGYKTKLLLNWEIVEI